MKKTLSLLLTLLLLAPSVASCNNEIAKETTAPETTAPETTAPETTAPETTAPETTTPETTAPETTAPETTAPETTASETTAPETTAPETTAPETTAPETTAPETTAPETTAPETTAPETTAPETTAPETTAPETTAPETTAPETTAPETTAPETTAPETTAPEQLPPETTAPETTAPETTAPTTANVPTPYEYFDQTAYFNAEPLTIRFKKATLTASQFEKNGEGADVTYTGWTATTNQKLENCYGIYFSLAAHKNLMSVAFYDADGNYISGVGTNSMNIYATSVSGFVVCPENAAKVRFLGFLGSDIMPEFENPTVLYFHDEESFNAARAMVPMEGLKIACLGDSLTEGDYGPKENGKGGRRFENYPYYLAQLTGAVTTNFGRCGANATSYLTEYYDAGHIDITDSDVILLMLGTNKGLAAGSDYYNDYCTLVDKILADKKPDAILVLITPPSATTDSSMINCGYMDDVLSANAAVLALAESKGLPCIDALKTSPIQPETEDLYQSYDGLHLTKEGYAAFAKYIAEELAKILE